MMRHNWLAVGFSVALTLHSSALFAQLKSENPAQTGEALAHDQNLVDLNLTWELVPRAPIKFTPFDMVDPNTGKPVKPDDIIEVNGVKMKAGEFYRRLNETERWLNAHGYSLRTDTVFEYYSPELEAQIADSERRLRELEAKMPFGGEQGNDQGDGNDFAPAGCNSASISRQTEWYGNNLFGARFAGYLYAYACYNSSTSFSARITGGMRILSRLATTKKTLVNVRGQANLTVSGNSATGSYTIYASVLDTVLVNRTVSVTISSSGFRYTTDDRLWQGNLWTSPMIRFGTIYLYGFPITFYGRVGVAGDLYGYLNIGIYRTYQYVQAAPYGTLSGWAEAYADAGSLQVFQAGVRGSLNFLSGRIETVAVGSFTNSYRQYDIQYAVNAINFRALDGNLSAFVRVNIPYIGSIEGTLPLYSWSGINWPSTTVFYETSSLSLR